jgi:hypothetical protein
MRRRGSGAYTGAFAQRVRKSQSGRAVQVDIPLRHGARKLGVKAEYRWLC